MQINPPSQVFSTPLAYVGAFLFFLGLFLLLGGLGIVNFDKVNVKKGLLSSILGLFFVVLGGGFIFGPGGGAQPSNSTQPDTATPTPRPPTSTPTPTNTPTPDVSMVLVPAGAFEMGSEGGQRDELPVHTVVLDAFFIDQYEVTNARYKHCVDEGICSPPSSKGSVTRGRYYSNAAYDDYPVIRVRWEQANTYCQWRGGRLPTEAEWEKAARGTDGRTYPWGEEALNRELANYGRNEGDTTPVGAYPEGASLYGAYDMAGNVWEWTDSWYQAYPGSDGQSLPGEKHKVLRGGSWTSSDFDTRASYRVKSVPANQGTSTGFRCASVEQVP